MNRVERPRQTGPRARLRDVAGKAKASRGLLVEGLVRHLLRPIAAGGARAKGALPSGKRLLLLHLDGVGYRQLDEALARGYAPTLRALLERGGHKRSHCHAGAPTSTPAFQAGLLYGVTADIPGYSWYDKRLRRPVRMDSSADARLLEEDLTSRGEPLLPGGSVYCSIFSGGAGLRRWALSGIDEELHARDFGVDHLIPEDGDPGTLGQRLRDLLAAGLVHAATAGRISTALGLSVATGLVETVRWASEVRSLQHEPQFLLHRVLTECLFAEFAANATVIDIARGTPIVYSCFIGYDEYSHRRGPLSRTALLKLWELDRALGRIFAAVQAVPELDYEIYLFSDHGQAATRPAEEVLGESLAEYLIGDGHAAPATAALAGGGQTASVAAYTRRWRRLARALPGLLGTAALAHARHAARALDGAEPEEVRAEGPFIVVPAGDLAHLYLTQVPEPVREAELRARHPGLIERATECPAVGALLLRGEDGPAAFVGGRRLALDRAADQLELNRVVGHPLAAAYSRDLLRLRSAGDLVLLGAGAPGGTVAFPWEFGSHGGLAPDALDTFVIHPAALGDEAFASIERPQELHRFFRRRGGFGERLTLQVAGG